MVASDTLRQGRFSFTDTVSMVKKFFITSSDDGFSLEMLPVWVAPSKKIHVEGVDGLISTWEVSSDVADQKYENDFQKVSLSNKRELSKFLVQENKLFKIISSSDGNTLQSKQARDSLKVLRAMEAPCLNKITLDELKYMKTAPLSVVWMSLLKNYADMLVLKEYKQYLPALKSLYLRLTTEMKQTTDGKTVYALLFPKATVGIGDEMADGLLYDREGQKHHLSELKGHYILLDFWSQGCGPCVSSLPEVERVSAYYRAQLSVVSISEDPKDMWLSYILQKKLSGHQWNELLPDRTGLALRYGVEGVPYYVLIGPDSKIVDIWTGYRKGLIEEKLKHHIR